MTENNSNDLNVDINVFSIVDNAYKEEHFYHRKNINTLGCSDLPFCPRNRIIARLYNISTEGNMKMLAGKIYHRIIQTPNVLKKLIKQLYYELGIHRNQIRVVPEKKLEFEILPGKNLEGHIDIYTQDFLIEIKTSSAPFDKWKQELVDYHLIQLNTYLGLTHIKLGFILYFNLRGFLTPMQNEDAWKRYGCILPVYFNQELFDNTIEKAKKMFECMERGEFNLPGPCFPWECNYCPKETQEICRKNSL